MKNERDTKQPLFPNTFEVIFDMLVFFTLLNVSSSCRGYPCPPFKIIILDEADSMTEDALVSSLLFSDYVVVIFQKCYVFFF